MPFQSEKQRRYLWANEPEIARDWTDTYGSRVQRDNGGIMQGGVQNFLGQQPTVNAPKYWQSAPGHEMTELAYITPQERDVLVDMDMYGTMRGGPNRGPSGIMSLNGWGSTDRSQERAGADISPSMDRGGGWSAPSRYDPSPGVPSYSTAMSPATLKLLSERQGGDTVLSSGMRNQLGMPAAQKSRFNPFKFLGGAFGNVGRGISAMVGMGKDFAGKMRGGINPKTGRYYTQREYEDEKRERIANKRIQNILGRDAPITATTQSNLANLYKQAGTTQGFMPEEGSTRTGRAIDKNVSMQDVLRERPFSTNTLREIQNQWDNQGIAGTQAYEEFSPDVALSKELANRADLPAYEEFRADKPVDKYKWDIGAGQRNDLVTQAAFVKDKFLKEQPFYKEPLEFDKSSLYNVTLYSLGDGTVQGRKNQELYKELRSDKMTKGKLLKNLQKGKYDTLPEKITTRLKEHVLKNIDFGDTFQENWSMGVVEPTFKGNRLDIKEGDLETEEMPVRPEEVLEMGVAEGGRISKALGGRSRDI